MSFFQKKIYTHRHFIKPYLSLTHNNPGTKLNNFFAKADFKGAIRSLLCFGAKQKNTFELRKLFLQSQFFFNYFHDNSDQWTEAITTI